MATEAFIQKRFSPAHLAIIETAREVCSDASAQGYNLTLRQVYYQFVAHHGLPNKQTEYKRLGGILNDARLAGLLDWSYMEDRTRNVNGGFAGYDDPGDYIEGVADGYFEALWEGQDYRPEVWIEKDALVSIVGRACGPTRTPHFSCRGYVSQSEMYDAAKRFQRRRSQGLTPVVIHLGDHDPSGIDMTRDIRDRLELMSWGDIEVKRIALTMDQVEQYNPPPNPAKITDSRAEDYIREYGPDSWELDALDPATLVDLIRDTIEEYVDRDTFDEAVRHEQDNEARIREVTDRWPDLTANWAEVLDVIGEG